MLPRTAKTLELLKKADWFSRVGRPDPIPVKVLSSWDEAVASSRSKPWRDLCLDMADIYLQKVLERSPARFQTWMDAPREAEGAIRALIEEKSKKIVKMIQHPHDLLNTLFWDVGHLLIEIELSDVCPADFYADLGRWYVKGRFPCGWEGAPPNGRLVIY
jgi:hypothetical protein